MKALHVLPICLLLAACIPSTSLIIRPVKTATPPPTIIVSPSPFPTLTVPSIVLSGHTDRVTKLAWSPDGSLLASATSGPTDFDVRMWNADGQLLYVLKGHTDAISSLAWSPDGKYLASGSADQAVRLWNPDGTLYKVIKIGRGIVMAVAWSPDGNALATSSMVGYLNPTVQLWHLDGTPIASMNTKYTGGKFYNLLWSPDGQRLLGGATDYAVWNKDGVQIGYLPGCEHCTPSWGAAWSPDGKMFAIGDENGDLYIYDRDANLLDAKQSSDDVNAIAWSPDGKLLAAGRDVWKQDGTLLTAVNGRVNSVAWSADGKFLAVAVDYRIYLIRSDGVHVATLIDGFNIVTWSPTDLVLASADGNDVRLWQVPSTP